MGREIRRVPPDWEHPKDARGHYIPLLDGEYEAEAAEWDAGKSAWDAGTSEDAQKYKDENCQDYRKWAGDRPRKEEYRPWLPEGSATAYQVYETVSEGTPMSPVFRYLSDLEVWLTQQGYSAKAAHNFAQSGYAPSMVVIPGRGIWNDIESCAIPGDDDG